MDQLQFIYRSGTVILRVLEAKKNHGDEEARARDLFYSLDFRFIYEKS